MKNLDSKTLFNGVFINIVQNFSFLLCHPAGSQITQQHGACVFSRFAQIACLFDLFLEKRKWEYYYWLNRLLRINLSIRGVSTWTFVQKVFVFIWRSNYLARSYTIMNFFNIFIVKTIKRIAAHSNNVWDCIRSHTKI